MTAHNFLGPTLRISAALLIALAGVSAASAQPAADAVVLAPHLAVYDLKLLETRGKQALESARGRILYDFAGNPCEGYALKFRQVTELDSEGKTAVSDLRTTNWEEANGKSFRFISQNLLNNQELDAPEGSAKRENDSVTVALKKPLEKRVDAGNVVFPSEHMRRIVAAGQAGQPLLEIGVYDGSDTGEKIYNTLTVIGQAIGPDRPPTDASAGQQALAAMKRWPVTISYFDRTKTDGDQTPLYSISFETFENGIARAIKLDYGNFVLSGELTSLEVRESRPCR